MASLAYAAASAIALASGPSRTPSNSGGSCWLRARRRTTARAFCVAVSTRVAASVGAASAASCGTPSIVAGSVGTWLGVAASVGKVVMVLILRAPPVLVRPVLGSAAAVSYIGEHGRGDLAP